MHSKLKGLEKEIQAYIDKHSDDEAVVERSRDVQHGEPSALVPEEGQF